MRSERHYINEVGIVLSAYLKDYKSECPGVCLVTLYREATRHVDARCTFEEGSCRTPIGPEYRKECADLLVQGVMMLLPYARRWATRDERVAP